MPRRLAAVVVAVVLGLVGCGGDEATPIDAPDVDARDVDADPDPDRTAALALLAVPCTDAPADVYLARTPPAPWTAADRGTVVACAYDRKVSRDEIRAHFTTEGVFAPSLERGAYKVRLAYWTERDPGEPVLTSAALYLPETRRTDGAMPLVVAGHGSVGSADQCAPSREDPDGFQRDFRTQIYPLVADGWIVIAPDYPGLGTPGVATWQHAPDEGHAMLDATRAARRVARAGLLSARNALVGHSNGGHAALAAQSYARSYGTDGTVDAVVVWAPLWISNAAWGALVSDAGAAFSTPAFLAMTLMYIDGHLEAYDGPAGVAAAYLPDKAAQVRAFLEGACWRTITNATTGPGSIGIALGRDAWNLQFVNEVGDCGLSDTCTTPLAATWRARFAADRPPPDPTIPIVLWQGARDGFLSPGFQKCGIDRLVAQGAMLTACLDGEADHSDIPSRSAPWVRAYLAEKLLGAAAPAACTPFASLDPPPSCAVPIPNGTAPTDP